jgi:hypothetical protein
MMPTLVRITDRRWKSTRDEETMQVNSSAAR